MTEFRRPTFEEIMADRMQRSAKYITRAEDAVKDKYISGLNNDYIHYKLYDSLKKLFELYRIADGGYYIEASWYIGCNSFRKMLLDIEFSDTKKKHTDYLLLIWDTEFPTPEDKPLAKSFLKPNQAVRLAAYFPRATGVASVKGPNKDIAFKDFTE